MHSVGSVTSNDQHSNRGTLDLGLLHALLLDQMHAALNAVLAPPVLPFTTKQEAVIDPGSSCSFARHVLTSRDADLLTARSQELKLLAQEAELLEDFETASKHLETRVQSFKCALRIALSSLLCAVAGTRVCTCRLLSI